MKKRFEQYCANKEAIWFDRFVWKGLFGDMPKYSIALLILQKIMVLKKSISMLMLIA